MPRPPGPDTAYGCRSWRPLRRRLRARAKDRHSARRDLPLAVFPAMVLLPTLLAAGPRVNEVRSRTRNLDGSAVGPAKGPAGEPAEPGAGAAGRVARRRGGAGELRGEGSREFVGEAGTVRLDDGVHLVHVGGLHARELVGRSRSTGRGTGGGDGAGELVAVVVGRGEAVCIHGESSVSEGGNRTGRRGWKRDGGVCARSGVASLRAGVTAGVPGLALLAVGGRGRRAGSFPRGDPPPVRGGPFPPPLPHGDGPGHCSPPAPP